LLLQSRRRRSGSNLKLRNVTTKQKASFYLVAGSFSLKQALVVVILRITTTLPLVPLVPLVP